MPGLLRTAVEAGGGSRTHHSPLSPDGPSQVDWESSPSLCSTVSDRETEIATYSLGEATIQSSGVLYNVSPAY